MRQGRARYGGERKSKAGMVRRGVRGKVRYGLVGQVWYGQVWYGEVGQGWAWQDKVTNLRGYYEDRIGRTSRDY